MAEALQVQGVRALQSALSSTLHFIIKSFSVPALVVGCVGLGCYLSGSQEYQVWLRRCRFKGCALQSGAFQYSTFHNTLFSNPALVEGCVFWGVLFFWFPRVPKVAEALQVQGVCFAVWSLSILYIS